MHLSDQTVKSGTVTKGQKVAVSGNSGNVDYHLHFDVNDVGKYSGLEASDMINPKIFYPSPRVNFTYSSSRMAVTEATVDEFKIFDNPEYFIDNALIDYVGKNAFEEWKKSLADTDVTVSALKNHFKISNEKEIELKETYYK